MRFIHRCVYLALVTVVCSTAAAQVTWPVWSPAPMPGPSKSPVPAPLPADVTITLPDATTPAAKSRWSGRWSGWACLDSVCDTRLAVERIGADGAGFVYVFGSASIKPNPQRVDGKFVGEELHGTLASGSRVAYRVRPDGALDFLFLPRTGNPVGGVLTKE